MSLRASFKAIQLESTPYKAANKFQDLMNRDGVTATEPQKVDKDVYRVALTVDTTGVRTVYQIKRGADNYIITHIQNA